MPISVIALNANQAIFPSLALSGMRILSGVVECVFKGAATGEITRDTLTFNVGRVNLGTGVGPTASCTISPSSFAYDGAVSDALWAVDGANVSGFTNEDRGSGTADLQITANLAVRGLSGVVQPEHVRSLEEVVQAEEMRRKEKQARKAEKTIIPVGSAQSAVPADGLASASHRQTRSRTLALVRDTRTIRFHANHVSSSASGDYYQAMFEAEENTNDPNSPYFLIQRQFETSDGGRCYIETHDEKYIGHFRLRRVEFTPEGLSIEFDRPSDNLVKVTFRMAVSDFEEASQVIKIISGEVDPQ